jgi:hypothetical protein
MNLSYLHKCPKDAKNGTCLFCFLLHKPTPCTQVLLRDLAPEIKGYEAETGFTPASRTRVQLAQESGGAVTILGPK